MFPYNLGGIAPLQDTCTIWGLFGEETDTTIGYVLVSPSNPHHVDIFWYLSPAVEPTMVQQYARLKVQSPIPEMQQAQMYLGAQGVDLSRLRHGYIQHHVPRMHGSVLLPSTHQVPTTNFFFPYCMGSIAPSPDGCTIWGMKKDDNLIGVVLVGRHNPKEIAIQWHVARGFRTAMVNTYARMNTGTPLSNIAAAEAYLAKNGVALSSLAYGSIYYRAFAPAILPQYD